MFEIFIAVFGTIYYGIKLASTKKHERQFEDRKEIYNSISRVSSDYYKVKELYNYFISDRWDCAERVSESIARVLGNKWRDALKEVPFYKPLLHSKSSGRFVDIWDLVFALFLSDAGLKTTSEYHLGCKLSNYTEEESQDILLKAFEEIEKNLISYYGNDYLLFSWDLHPSVLMFKYKYDYLDISNKTRIW